MNDLEAAVGRTATATHPAGASLSKLGRLVEAMLNLKSTNSILVNKDAFALLMPGNTGIHLLRQGSAASKAQLVEVISKLRLDLCTKKQLPEAYISGLPEDSPEYQLGLDEYRDAVLKEGRDYVEEQVVKRNLILRAMEQLESANNASKDKKRLEAINALIAGKLRLLSAWEVLGTSDAPRWEATTQVIAKAHKGEYPWDTVGDAGEAPEALERHYAERYRTAAAHVERAKEEIVYLKMEVLRLVNGVEERIAAVNSAVEADKIALVALGGDGAARKAMVLAGRIQFRSLECERLEMIRDEARKLREDNLFA